MKFPLGPILVRNVEDATVRKLRRRAERRGRTMNEEVCQILRNAVQDEDRPFTELAVATRPGRVARRRFVRKPRDSKVKQTNAR